MARFFVFALLLWIAYFLVKKFFTALQGHQDPAAGTPAPNAELVKDPECGAYFLKSKGIKGVVNGKVIHFCSEDCYDKFLKKHTRK